jgi:hypothetical protein
MASRRGEGSLRAIDWASGRALCLRARLGYAGGSASIGALVAPG